MGMDPTRLSRLRDLRQHSGRVIEHQGAGKVGGGGKAPLRQGRFQGGERGGVQRLDRDTQRATALKPFVRRP